MVRILSFDVVRRITSLLLQCIVYGVMAYSWYTYVFRLCVKLLIVNTKPNISLAGALIAFSSMLSLMATISYTRILFAAPGYPAQIPLQQEMVESALTTTNQDDHLTRYSPSLFNETSPKSLHAQSTTPTLSISEQDGSPRYCDLCRCFKPDRTHHCGVCNVCVLKMDHHCPWINNCVGHHNYKLFFLFVAYTALYGLWCLGSGIPLVVIALHDIDADIDPHWIVFLALAFVIGLTVTCFGLNHLRYILVNRTTIEHVLRQKEHVRVDFDSSGVNYQVVEVDHPERLWDLGKMTNWKIIMGDSAIEWFLPIRHVVGNGTTFPYCNSLYQQIIAQTKRPDVTL